MTINHVQHEVRNSGWVYTTKPDGIMACPKLQ